MNLAALETVIRENDIPRLKRDRLIKKLRKQDKRGNFKLDLKDIEWVWRLAAANLMNGEFSFWGYEFRSSWALDLFRNGWIYPKWDGQNHRCLVMAEQGIGDEILFSSVFREFLKDCPDAVIECDDRLLPVFKRNFESHFISRWRRERGVGNELDDYKKGEFDSFVPAGDLLRCYRIGATPPGEPYLKPDIELVNYYKNYADKIGLSWKGGRSEIQPDNLKCEDAISLQYKKTTVGIEGEIPPGWMVDPGLDHNDMEKVFALVSVLKEVRSVFSYMCHVAGALGVRVKAIKPPYQCMKNLGTGNNRLKWPYMTGQGAWKTPWYNSMTVYESWKHLS